MTNTIPKSLYITNIKTDAHLGPIGAGGFGLIYKGKYNGQQVALKVVDKSRHDVSTLPFFSTNTERRSILLRALLKKTLCWRP